MPDTRTTSPSQLESAQAMVGGELVQAWLVVSSHLKTLKKDEKRSSGLNWFNFVPKSKRENCEESKTVESTFKAHHKCAFQAYEDAIHYEPVELRCRWADTLCRTTNSRLRSEMH